jgi:hypothetical protein
METIMTTTGKAVPTARRKAPKAASATKAPKAPKAPKPIIGRKDVLTTLRSLKANKVGASTTILGFRAHYGRAPREGHKGRWDHVFTLVRGKTRKLEAECVTLPAEAAADFLYETQPGAEPEKKPAKPAKKAA